MLVNYARYALRASARSKGSHGAVTCTAVRRSLHQTSGARSASTPATKQAVVETTAKTGAEESSLKGPISWATFILVAAGGASAVVYYNIKKEQKKVEAATKVETYGRPSLGGPWSLVDSEGHPVTSGDLAGKYYLLYFGFTFCPDICPNELVKMGRAIKALEKRSNVPEILPVFVTLDPHRDSCAQVGTYVKDFHPNMLGLTGTPAQVAKVAKAFRVYFADVDRKEDDDDYLDFYTQLMTAPEIADKIAARIGSTAPTEPGWLKALGFGKK